MKTNTLISALCFGVILTLSDLCSAGQLSPTIYFIKVIDLDQECKTKKTIHGQQGQALFNVCKESYNSCVIEGTCAILKDEEIPEPSIASDDDDDSDPQTALEIADEEEKKEKEAHAQPASLNYEIINYVKSDKHGVPLFMMTDEEACPWGYGVKAICLDPFYTVAADMEYHKPGEVLFVDRLKGIILPNGEVHSGFVIVRDRGAAIKGPDRFDFYTGLIAYKDPKNPFTAKGFAASSNKFNYRKATESEAKHFRLLRNFPKVPKVIEL